MHLIRILLERSAIISDQVSHKELEIILKNLKHIIDGGVDGDIVEMGCYSGTTSLFISRLLQELESKKYFHVYDSFAGLPEKTSKDASPAGEQFQAGELIATKSQFLQNYKKANLKPPVVHKGWFEDLKPADLPDQICFAFLDGDYYSSIHSCLKLVWPKLSPKAVVIVDDYQNEALPGARRAVDDWLATHPGYKLTSSQSLAIITKH